MIGPPTTTTTTPRRPRRSTRAASAALSLAALTAAASRGARFADAFSPSNFAAAPSSSSPSSLSRTTLPHRRHETSSKAGRRTMSGAGGPLHVFDPSLADAAASAAALTDLSTTAGAATTGFATNGFAAGLGSALDSASTLLSHGAEAAAHGHGHHVPEYDTSNPLQVLLHSPTPWSVVVMLSIVALLVAWEESIKTVREGLPPALMSVVDSMLAEMGGLGFIGLFLQAFVTGGILGGVVGELSETFLGEEEILLETFEFLHTVFFEVGIGFFAISGLAVFAVLNRIKELEKISELALDTDGDGEVSLEEMADALHVDAMIVDENGDGVLDESEITNALRNARKLTVIEEIELGDAERGAEALVVRERLIRVLGLPDDFKVEYYFERVFARELEEIVELSPLTWLPLIPLIALDDTVDLTHDVISAASANAAESSGWFVATPWFFIPCLTAQVVCVVWGLFNLWKMTSIKVMLLPTLVRDGSEDGPALLLPPRYEDPVLMKNFDSSPSVFGAIEEFVMGWSKTHKPATNDHERLFGVPGAGGPRLYRDSIKFHTWLCVAQIVFFGGQIVVRDAWALLDPEVTIGCPEFVVPELAVFSFFVALSAAQLALAPTTFLNYCFSSSIETMVNTKMMAKAEKDSLDRAERDAEEARLAAEEAELDRRKDNYTGKKVGRMAGAGGTNGAPASSADLEKMEL